MPQSFVALSFTRHLVIAASLLFGGTYVNEGLCHGRLVAWKDDKGFGFIQTSGQKVDIFLHISELKDSTRRPKVGDTIYYYPVIKGDKISARNAFILGARKRPSDRHGSSSKHSTKGLPVPWNLVGLLMLLPVTGAITLLISIGQWIPCFLYPGMSLIAFAAYSEDKRRAQQDKWRISEDNLHLLEMMGGWPGGLIAQCIFRHKSSKDSYQRTFWAIVILHQIGWLFWLLFGRTLIR